jgi:dethiobiotin synthetase
LWPEDGSFLREASDEKADVGEIVPYRYSLPASPARAALTEKQTINTTDLVDRIRASVRDADLTVIEGAGGLMVPINLDTNMIDLAQLLGYPVILTARMRLGTINHTLLSLEALERRNLPVVAIVLSHISPEVGPEEEFTPQDVERLAGGIPVLVLPHLDSETVGSPRRISKIMAQSWPKELINLIIGA